MRHLLLFTVIGFVAQLIDGSLGMAYGVTSSTLLLGFGLAPAVASASVHLSEVGTTFVSGLSHWRFGNVDWPTVRRIAGPGAVGAFLGATALSSLSAELARPWVAGFLFLLGVYVLVRFAVLKLGGPRRPPLSRKKLGSLGVVAGFLDAAGGGGWGPIATPTLLVSDTLPPNKVVGSVDTSEFLVTTAASLGFLLGLGHAQVNWPIVVALLGSGVVAAPLAAWLVRIVPGRLLGVGAGGLILVTNARTIVHSLQLPSPGPATAYALLAALWLAAFVWAIVLLRRDGREDLSAAVPA